VSVASTVPRSRLNGFRPWRKMPFDPELRCSAARTTSRPYRPDRCGFLPRLFLLASLHLVNPLGTTASSARIAVKEGNSHRLKTSPACTRGAVGGSAGSPVSHSRRNLGGSDLGASIHHRRHEFAARRGQGQAWHHPCKIPPSLVRHRSNFILRQLI
jgi:hypothetical protein